MSQSRPSNARRLPVGAISWEDAEIENPDLNAVDDESLDLSDTGSDYTTDNDVLQDIDPELDVMGSGYGGDDIILDEEVEENIEEDFQLLLDDIQISDAATADRPFNEDFTISAAHMDFQQELRSAAGIGKRRGRRSRTERSYTEEVEGWLGEANEHFVHSEHDEAIALLHECIRVDPYVPHGWSTLAAVHEDKGNEDKALKFKIVAAHVSRPDAEVWKELGVKSSAMGLKQQALYCFRKAAQIDKKDVHALWERAFVLKELGQLRQALDGFLGIAKLQPHHPSVLEQVYQISLRLGDSRRCAELYQDAFDHYTRFPPSAENFDYDAVATLADLHIDQGNYEGAVQAVKVGVRWLQNRAAESQWDLIDDDREYDVRGTIRDTLEGQPVGVGPGYHALPINLRHRLGIARSRMGDDFEAKIHFDIILKSSDSRDYSELFLEIADALFDREQWNDAYNVYESLQLRDETRSIRSYLRMSECSRNVGDLDMATSIVEHVAQVAPDDLDAKMALAAAYEASGQKARALQLVMEVIAARKETTIGQHEDSAQPDYPTGGSIFDEVLRADKASKTTRLSTEQKQEAERQRQLATRRAFDTLKDLSEGEKNDDPVAVESWMKEAGSLVHSFREARVLFPANRYAKYTGRYGKVRTSARTNKEIDFDRDVADMASRLQGIIEDGPDPKVTVEDVTDFRGVHLEEWLLLIVKYSFRLLRQGQAEDADAMLRHVAQASVYSFPPYDDVISLSLLACAIYQGNVKEITDIARKLMYVHQFNNDALRLFVSALGSGLPSYGQFTNPRVGKVVRREMRTADLIVRGADAHFSQMVQRFSVQGSGREGRERRDRSTSRYPSEAQGEADNGSPSPAGSGDEENILASSMSRDGKVPKRHVKIPTKTNPVMLTVYAHMLLAVKSYSSALFYLSIAYDCNPYDPMLCLTIAIAYVGRSMQRQSDNRHHQIVQGLAFLARYRNMRGGGMEEEVEYNFGRYFHQIGLVNLAGKHYRKVLEIAQQKKDEGQQPTLFAPVREAAYNLSLIYVTSGAGNLAQALYRQWLTI